MRTLLMMVLLECDLCGMLRAAASWIPRQNARGCQLTDDFDGAFTRSLESVVS
jgi:hypothetical protein